MSTKRGFTLIETLVTTAILVFALIAAASMFSYSVGTNITNQQRTAATLLLYEKMEQFRSASLSDSAWTAGGGLNPASPTSGYFDYVTIGSDGTITSSATDTNATYIRLWQITGTNPRSVTIVVYVQRSGISRGRIELIRATTLMTNTL